MGERGTCRSADGKIARDRNRRERLALHFVHDARARRRRLARHRDRRDRAAALRRAVVRAPRGRTKGTIGFIKQDPVVYALHAGADAPEVDAFVGDSEIIDGIAFGGISHAIQVPPAEYTIDFFAHSGTGIRPASAPAASLKTGALEAGQRYLGIATGFLTAQPSFRLLAEAESFSLDDGQTHIRAVHASPDAPMVDIGVATTAGVSPVLFSQLTFGNASTDVDVSPGAVTLGVAASTNDKAVLYQFPLTLEAGKRLFAVAEGAPTKNVAFRLGIVDTTATPWTITHVAASK